MHRKYAFPIITLAALLAGGAQAQTFKPKAAGLVVLDARLTTVSPVGTDPVTTLAGAPTPLRSKVSDDVVPTIGLGYFFTDHVAVEVIAGTSRHKVRAVGPGVDLLIHKSWVLPPVVTVQYHFAPASRVSPYVGAGVNYMLFYGSKDANGFKLKIKDGVGTALQAGVDIAAHDHWTVNVDVKKIFFDTKAVDTTSGIKTRVTLDPWVASAGIGYRF